MAPLRERSGNDAVTQLRFETAPGEQSQVDWGQARVCFRQGVIRLHVFVLTLGFRDEAFTGPRRMNR